MELHEKCGVVGIFANENDISRLVYYGLWSLQHRGQENSGIVSSNGKQFFSHKGHGLVSHVYGEKDLKHLKGHIAIGHNRYGTFGKSHEDHSQPVFNYHDSIALAHNGNFPDVSNLKKFLKSHGISTQNLNDSELAHAVIQYWVVRGSTLKEAVEQTFPLLNGAFSFVIMSKKELVAVRDEHGIRPLCLGRINGSTCVVASESCALSTIGAEFHREINPGEMLVINSEGLKAFQLAKPQPNVDVFEFVYFARPDSNINGKNVYQVRKNLGTQLAAENNIKADIIIPVPDSGIPSAIGYSLATGIPFEEALIKNRYIHRTFIAPSQKQRTNAVSMKLNLVKNLVKGKRVILIDDSIVRGTTSKRLIELIKTGQPKEIHLLVTSPPVKYPDFYGINTPNQKELISARMNNRELAAHIGAKSVRFLSFDGMIKAVGIPESELCCACFNGVYPIKIGQKANRVRCL